uniref:F-box domain-containing protein n=1 Tax=Caenorhabditis tropicalis TaxID=1561998 RepID=A0A1I7T424_9PELO
MNLFNLPLLVLIDVFKMMEFRERFLISLMSKRAKRMLTLTSVPIHLSCNLLGDLYIRAGTDTQPNQFHVADEESDLIIGGEAMRINFYPDGLTLEETSPKNQLLLISHLLETYRKPAVSVKFYYPTQPVMVWEFMRMVNQRRVCVKSFSCLISWDSSEFIPKILDECTEVTDFIQFNAMLRNDFFYTPPRPFKATEFRVNVTSNWFNPEGFMSCRRIILQVGERSKYTAQWWNAFIQKWIDSDVPLEHLSCNHNGLSDFQSMIKGLSQPGIEQMTDGVVVKRRDRSEFVISSTLDRFFIMTKEEHTEHSQKHHLVNV